MAEAGWHLTVDPACDGWRLDRFLAHRLARVSRARAARLEVRDEDTPSRAPLRKSDRVRKGQRLFARRPVPDAGVSLPPPAVLYEDASLLVLDKPPGWAAHPTASRYEATLKWWLHEAGYDAGHEPVHRLDVETSGVIAVARTVEVARRLKGALANGESGKTYLAVVEGAPPADEWTVDVPLGFDAASAVRLKMGRGELPAETSFRVLWRGAGRAVVEAAPQTGRQHQIRVHLAMGGIPLVGDKLYGPDEGLFLASLDRPLEPDELARLGHPRHALHAWRLTLPGWASAFEAPWPADLRDLAPGFNP